MRGRRGRHIFAAAPFQYRPGFRDQLAAALRYPVKEEEPEEKEKYMKWYPKLYIGSGAQPNAGKIIRKLKKNTIQPGIYVITLAENGQDMLDILPSVMLQQTKVREQLPMIVGLAKGKREALELARQIVQDTFDATGGCDVPGYLRGQADGGNVTEE